METQTADDRSQTISTGFLDGARKNYPREVQYVIVALALAAITGLEIATYAAPGFPLWNWGEKAGLVSFLLLLMAIKFWTVAYFFMHLRYERRSLSLILLPGLIFIIVLLLAFFPALYRRVKKKRRKEMPF